MQAQFIIKIWLIIHIALGVAALAATISNTVSGFVLENPKTENLASEVIIIEEGTKSTNETEIQDSNPRIKNTKEIVFEYFEDVPVMIDVAYCESRYTQFNYDGSVHRGVVNPDDVGVMQINEQYHLDTSRKLGINIHTLEGNLEYARFLYETQGTKPWEYSSHCWNKKREVALN